LTGSYEKIMPNDDELNEYPIRNLTDGWFFRVIEISPNIYRVEGIDRFGRSVSRTGTEIELDSLLKLCAQDAQQIKDSLE
jgi:hypothetical protein